MATTEYQVTCPWCGWPLSSATECHERGEDDVKEECECLNEIPFTPGAYVLARGILVVIVEPMLDYDYEVAYDPDMVGITGETA